MADLLTKASANLSSCGKYRYWLERRWGEGSPQVFVMLNPSTADAEVDDPTIRRCVSFARREGAGGLIVVNLFALRATDPKELDRSKDRIGPGNTRAVGEALLMSAMSDRPVICAWGANKNAIAAGLIVERRAADLAASLRCLGKTSAGAPRHPLYVKGDAPLISYP